MNKAEQEAAALRFRREEEERAYQRRQDLEYEVAQEAKRLWIEENNNPVLALRRWLEASSNRIDELVTKVEELSAKVAVLEQQQRRDRDDW